MVRWIRHIWTIQLLSLFATITLFPLSVVDSYFIGSFTRFWFIGTAVAIIVCDTISAKITHKFASSIVNFVVKSEKNKQKLEEVGKKLEKYGTWGMVLFASTPLPYSLAIYFYAGANVRFTKILVPLVIGRTIKYTAITLMIVYGISLF